MADLVVRSRLTDATPAMPLLPGVRPEEPVLITVYPVLDYFSTCPRCGYPAEASTTVRTYADGGTTRETHTTCGMPCGWDDSLPAVSLSHPSATFPPDTLALPADPA
ncbi:hypothetical protein [Nocardia rhamnosiphila]